MKKANISKSDDRVSRWRKHIEAILENSRNNEYRLPASSVRVIEEIEGKDIVQVILDRLCVRRGYGVRNPTMGQAYNARIDKEYEDCGSTLARNNHERECAVLEIMFFLESDLRVLPRSERARVAFLRKYYRKGDDGACNESVRRALADACRPERRETHSCCRGITATSSRDSVTIMVSGKAFENVRELTSIFNAWDKNHLTPAGYILEHMLDCDWWDGLEEKESNFGFPNAAGMLVGKFDRCEDIGELRAALESAGFGISY